MIKKIIAITIAIGAATVRYRRRRVLSASRNTRVVAQLPAHPDTIIQENEDDNDISDEAEAGGHTPESTYI
jgi:hypothetical protein